MARYSARMDIEVFIGDVVVETEGPEFPRDEWEKLEQSIKRAVKGLLKKRGLTKSEVVFKGGWRLDPMSRIAESIHSNDPVIHL